MGGGWDGAHIIVHRIPAGRFYTRSSPHTNTHRASLQTTNQKPPRLPPHTHRASSWNCVPLPSPPSMEAGRARLSVGGQAMPASLRRQAGVEAVQQAVPPEMGYTRKFIWSPTHSRAGGSFGPLYISLYIMRAASSFGPFHSSGGSFGPLFTRRFIWSPTHQEVHLVPYTNQGRRFVHLTPDIQGSKFIWSPIRQHQGSKFI